MNELNLRLQGKGTIVFSACDKPQPQRENLNSHAQIQQMDNSAALPTWTTSSQRLISRLMEKWTMIHVSCVWTPNYFHWEFFTWNWR